MIVTEKLKWFIIWTPSLKAWSVMRGGFCDSYETSKTLAGNRRDELNKITNIFEGHLKDNFV